MDNGIQGILFDLDGVLIDAPEWHKEALNDALRCCGCDPISDEEHYSVFNGLSTRKKLKLLSEQGKITSNPLETVEEKMDRIHKVKQNFTIGAIKERCRPVTRVIDTVVYANSIFGGKTGVVTNCSRHSAELMLTKANLIDRFKVIVTNEDVDGKIKPHPWPYIKAQIILGFGNQPKSILAIDDTDKGIMSAVDAQCRTWHLKSFEGLSVRTLMRVLSNYKITI